MKFVVLVLSVGTMFGQAPQQKQAPQPMSFFVTSAGPGKGADIKEQIHTVLDVLKVMRHYSSSTYREEGMEVTHSELVITDR